MKDEFPDMAVHEKKGFWLFRYRGENAGMVFLKIILWLIIVALIRMLFIAIPYIVEALSA